MNDNYKKPVPEADDASRPFFDGANQGHLMLMRCESCGAYRFPSRDRCDVCWSTETAWVEASGKGTVYTFGIMHQLYHPGFKDEIPYNVTVVELAEGPRITTNIVDCPNDQIRAGMAVEATFARVSDSVSLPKFRPVA